MVSTIVLILASASSPSDDRAFQILTRMAEALKSVERVELGVEFETVVFNGSFKCRVLAEREPKRYWAKLEASDGSSEFAYLSDLSLTFTAEDGRRKIEKLSSFNSVFNDAASVGVLGWRLFLDREWLSGFKPEDTFYVHEETVDGQLCDVIARRRTTVDYEQITTINYFWVNRRTNLPEVHQIHALIRGSSTVGPRWRYKNVSINPTWGPNSFTPIPEQVPVVRRPAYFSNGPAKAIALGAACPDVEVETLDFTKTTLDSHLRGKTLLTFWAPWCGPCLSEQKALKEIPEVKDGRIRVVAVGTFDSKSAIQKYAKENLAQFQVLIDPEAEFRTSKLAQTFGVSGIPHAFLFGEDGKLIRQWVGFSSVEELTSKLRGDK